MSNDLISRKSIIKKLENALLNDDLTIGEQGLLSDIVSFVAIETTAYDIDKVVEELEKSSKWVNETNEYCNDDGNDYIPLSKAIEIVKKGSVDDDVCEWHKAKIGNAYKCNTHAEMHDSRVLDWCCCPYCRKKIKVVE